jgi:hypothetical protein
MRAAECEDPDYTKWTVDTDVSVGLTDVDADAFPGTHKLVSQFPIEIKSRVMSLTENLPLKNIRSRLGHTHEISYDVEIDAVYRSLNRHFNSPNSDKNLRLVIHDSCSTHVHIGNSLNGFPAATVKKALSLCIAHEQLIDNLHSTSRINGSTLISAQKPWTELIHHSKYIDHVTSDVYNMPWSSHFAQAAFLHSDARGRSPAPHLVSRHLYPGSRFETDPELKDTVQRFDVPSWLTLVATAEDIDDLKNLQQFTSKRSIVNFHNLLDYRSGEVDDLDVGYMKMTVEFRQHAGTLQSQETLPWLKVLTRLVEFAHETSEDEIMDMCLSHWPEKNFTSIDFLKMIGVDADTLQHYELVLGKSGPSSYADEVRRKERDAASAVPWNEVLSPMSQYLIEKRTGAIRPENVSATIQAKLVRGGYGQFPAGYFADAEMAEEMQEILTVGARPPWAQLTIPDCAVDVDDLQVRRQKSL